MTHSGKQWHWQISATTETSCSRWFTRSQRLSLFLETPGSTDCLAGRELRSRNSEEISDQAWAASAGEPFFASSQSYNLGNPLSLTLGTQAGMKSISCTIWVLGALMVMASLDTVADPSAVSPQVVNVISHLRERPDGFCERLTCDSSCTSSRLQICWVAFTSAYEPNRPSDRIALTGHASDPSPPALEARRTPYFQS
jgi:hypothetical protein